jgi:hypothetical protein
MGYSSTAPGGDIFTECDDMASSIDDKVFFAGEHTYY